MKLLRDRRLAALLAAEVISSTGSQMTWVALPWFVLHTTGSPERMSWVLIAEIVPIAVLGLRGGAVASRIGTRTTMLVSDAVRAPLFAAIPLLHALGLLPFPLLLALVALSGVFLAPYMAVQRSVIPELVGEEQGDVATAAALSQAANRLTIFVGPALAGVLIGVMSASNVLYVDAATYLAAVVLVGLFVHVPKIELPADAHGALAGAQFVMRDRLLRIWQPSFTLLDVCWTVFFACLPVLAFKQYHQNPRVVGYLIGALGLGALVGAFAALPIVRRVDALLLGICAFVGQMAFIWGSIVPTHWLVPAAAIACAGFFMSLVNSPIHALYMLRVPRELRTQAMAFSAVAQSTGAPVGLVFGGIALAHFDTRHVMAVVLAVQSCAVASIVLAGIAERSALRRASVDSPA